MIRHRLNIFEVFVAVSSFVKHWVPLTAIAVSSVLTACSENDNNRTANIITAKVQAGQEDINEGMVRRILVTEEGELNSVSEGVFIFDTLTTDEEGLVETFIAVGELNYFDLYGRVASSGVDQTTRRCQLVAGCNEFKFGDDMPIVQSPGWSSLAFDLAEDEKIRLTALTTLAEKLAFGMVFSETSGDQQDEGWLETGYYSDYSAVQSVSQISKLFGVSDVQTTQPADLTQLDELANKNTSEATDSIRYGALLAAWQSYELSFTATQETPFLADAVAQDLLANSAQLFQKGGDQTLALAEFYQAAADNLAAVEQDNSTVEGYVDAVVTALRAEADAFTADALTSVTPASLLELLGQEDLDEYQLGLQRSKAFVDYLRDYENNFFEEGYKAEIDLYTEQLQSLGDAQADNLDTLVTAYVQTFEFYRACYTNAACPSPSDDWGWLENYRYSSDTGVLTLNNEAIRVSQEVADLDLTDDDSEPAESQAIDVLITGRYFDDLADSNLQLDIDHEYVENSDNEQEISNNSAIRVFYANAVAELQDSADTQEIGYRLRWSDFALHDTKAVDTDAETEIEGSFAISYIGVEDPDGNGEMHYNIESAALNGRISDQVDDDDTNSEDRNISLVTISASSSNETDFYPESKFTSFNGFFNPVASDTYVDGYVAENLVSYRTGSEQINGTEILFFDYFIQGSDDLRYRFYPTVMREDVSDSDRDGDFEEEIATFDFEQCVLTGGPDAAMVSECEPKQRLSGERDVQFAVNELWESGVFSRPEVAGQGSYFIEFPVNAADENGCLSLADLPNTLTAISGELYRPAVLGLDSARLTTEVTLDYDADSTDEPRTLLDILVTAPAMDELEVSAALSHDYSSNSTSNSGVIVGSGADLDRLILNYSRSQDTLETGSISVYKDGLALALADGSQDEIDSELLAGGELETATDSALSKYIVNEDGFLDLCVVDNSATADVQRNTDNAVWVINYRDVVYAKVAQENGAWVIRYIDGSWEIL